MKKGFLLFFMLLCSCMMMAQSYNVNENTNASGYVFPLHCDNQRTVFITRFGPTELNNLNYALSLAQKTLQDLSVVNYDVVQGNYAQRLEYYNIDHQTAYGQIPVSLLNYVDSNSLTKGADGKTAVERAGYTIYNNVEDMFNRIVPDSLFGGKRCFIGFIVEKDDDGIPTPMLYILHVSDYSMSVDTWDKYYSMFHVSDNDGGDNVATNELYSYPISNALISDVTVDCANTFQSIPRPSLNVLEWWDGYPQQAIDVLSQGQPWIVLVGDVNSDEYDDVVAAIHQISANPNDEWYNSEKLLSPDYDPYNLSPDQVTLLNRYLKNGMLVIGAFGYGDYLDESVHVPVNSEVSVRLFPYFDVEKIKNDYRNFIEDPISMCVTEDFSYEFKISSLNKDGLKYGYPDDPNDPIPFSIQQQPAYSKRMYYDDPICLPVKYAQNARIVEYYLKETDDSRVRNSINEKAMYLIPLNGDSVVKEVTEQVYKNGVWADTTYNKTTYYVDPQAGDTVYFKIDTTRSYLKDFAEGRYYKFLPSSDNDLQSAPAYNGADSDGPQNVIWVGETCYPNEPFTLKIIPYYAYFWGYVMDQNLDIEFPTMNNNWNVDYNWLVAEENGAPKPYEDDYGDANPIMSFVPSYKTKVFVELSRVVLAEDPCDGSTADDCSKRSNWDIDGDIQYEDGYRINTCDSIHLWLNLSKTNMATAKFAGTTGANLPYYFGSDIFLSAPEGPYVNALVGNQQYLNYNGAMVDYSIQQKTWTIMGFPLNDMVSGDIYAEEKWKESTYPDFMLAVDISTGKPFSNATKGDVKNIRVWQKLFNHNMLSKQISGDNITINSTAWNTPANTVKHRYNPGTPIMMWILPVTDSMEREGDVRLHFPKRDTEYYYYLHNGTEKTNISEKVPLLDGKTTRSARLAFGKNEDNTLGDSNMAITLTATSPSTQFAFANPTLDAIKLDEFFKTNSQLVPNKYDIITGNETSTTASAISVVGTKSSANFPNEGLHRAGWLYPGEAIMIYSTAAATTLSVTIPKEAFMAYVEKQEEQTIQPSPAVAEGAMLYMTAKSPKHTSYASIYVDATANNSYNATEDAEMVFVDGSLTPTAIYTIADNHALSVNGVASFNNIPVAVYAADTTITTIKVTFNGVESFDGNLSLLDVVNGTTTLIAEGDVLTLATTTTNDNIRYYLQKTINTIPDTDIADSNNDINIFVAADGTIQVVANDELVNVVVYGATGQEVMKNEVNSRFMSCSLPTGVYMVKAYTQHSQTVKKVVVK